MRERDADGGGRTDSVAELRTFKLLSFLVSLSEIGTSLSPEGVLSNLPSLSSVLRMFSTDETSGLLGRGGPIPNLEVKKKVVPSPVIKRKRKGK